MIDQAGPRPSEAAAPAKPAREALTNVRQHALAPCMVVCPDCGNDGLVTRALLTTVLQQDQVLTMKNGQWLPGIGAAWWLAARPLATPSPRCYTQTTVRNIAVQAASEGTTFQQSVGIWEAVYGVVPHIPRNPFPSTQKRWPGAAGSALSSFTQNMIQNWSANQRGTHFSPNSLMKSTPIKSFPSWNDSGGLRTLVERIFLDWRKKAWPHAKRKRWKK
jgi:hypothetical protein